MDSIRILRIKKITNWYKFHSVDFETRCFIHFRSRFRLLFLAKWVKRLHYHISSRKSRRQLPGLSPLWYFESNLQQLPASLSENKAFASRIEKAADKILDWSETDVSLANVLIVGITGNSRRYHWQLLSYLAGEQRHLHVLPIIL